MTILSTGVIKMRGKEFDKKKIIWISFDIPYPNVAHAGGKTHNFYLTKLIEQDKYDVRLITFYRDSDLKSFVLNKYIQCDLIPRNLSFIKSLKRKFIGISNVLNPFDKYGNFARKYDWIQIVKILKKYKKEGFNPDIIILHWTQIVLAVDRIKKVFPDSRIIAIEEDVSFLSFQRRIELANTHFERKIAEIRYENLKKSELNALNLCDRVILNNEKDKRLLADNGFTGNIRIWSVYFEKLYRINRCSSNHRDIIFYGAMNRRENYDTAEWLITKVYPLIKDYDVRIVILGGNPTEKLKSYANDRIIITGFVDDIGPFFENGLCLAAPLILGAGIKVKILESMTAGLPVLTNNIGIEGIPAENGTHYFHCETPGEYAEVIRRLTLDKDLGNKVGLAGRELVKLSFDYEKDAEKFLSWIDELL